MIVCGSEIVQRDDETRRSYPLNRLDVYNEQTAPLVEFYRNEDLLVTVPSSDIDEVMAALRDRLYPGHSGAGSFLRFQVEQGSLPRSPSGHHEDP